MDCPPVFVRMNIEFVIDERPHNLRLDSLVCSRLKGCSRSRSVDFISTGRIRVNGQVKKPGYKVKLHDRITGRIPSRRHEIRILPEKITIDIVYEDRDLLVVNKPPGMVVHPAPGNMSGTLVNALIAHDPVIEAVGGDRRRAGIIHRLDKDTSGLMVVAKTDQALLFLQNEFQQRRVQKKYLALVTGLMPEQTGQIDLPVGRHPVKRKQMAVNRETGRHALSFWKVVKRFESACLVEVLLKTGRTHQIRVHFYAVKHPLIGDTTYQFRRNRKKKQLARRQMLHSYKLSFRHPYSGQRLEFKTPPPDDFVKTMKLLEK